MSDSARLARLARVAAAIGARGPFSVPPLVLMTDDERLADPLAAACALPLGAMVVVRSRDDDRRKQLACAMLSLSQARGLFVLIAGDAALALSLGADGVHLPEARMAQASAIRARHRALVITAAIHSLAALGRASLLPIDALFLSPVFATPSHPGGAALSPMRANLIASAAKRPVYALGGINAHNALRLSPGAFAGFAAIGALDVKL
jgi:thiamine-phosphate pyrophosphorylase